MIMNRELIEKAKEAESVEALFKLAEENKIELSREKADKIFSQLHREGEVVDDELSSVSGGGCSDVEWVAGAKYKYGQIVRMGNGKYYGDPVGGGWCKYCSLSDNAEIISSGKWGWGWPQETYYTVKCLGCGYTTDAADSTESPGAAGSLRHVIVGAV